MRRGGVGGQQLGGGNSGGGGIVGGQQWRGLQPLGTAALHTISISLQNSLS